MKVHELIEKLQQFDTNDEIEIFIGADLHSRCDWPTQGEWQKPMLFRDVQRRTLKTVHTEYKAVCVLISFSTLLKAKEFRIE